MKSTGFLTLFLAFLFINQNSNGQLSLQFNPIPSGLNINSTNPVYATNIYYDNIDTSTQAFHIFLPDTANNYPLIIFIHGGGFRGGDRDQIFSDVGLQQSAKYFLENNVAFATIGYRLLPPDMATYTDSIGVIKCLGDSKRALQFIRYYSNDLYINPEKIALKGSSAGAGTSLWLASRSDMAETNSADPVLQQSTRVCAAHVRGSQSTYDLYKWETNVYENFDGLGTTYTVDSMVQLIGFERYADFYGGLDSNYHFLYDPTLIQYREDVDMLFHMSDDDPAIYIESPSQANHPSEDLMHHSLHALEIYNTAVAASINEVICNISAQGIDNTAGETGDQFLLRLLGTCSLSLSSEDSVKTINYNIFPNPSSDLIYLQGLAGNESIQVLNMSGQFIQSIRNNNQIDVSNLSPGTYLIVIQNNHTTEVLKFLKN